MRLLPGQKGGLPVFRQCSVNKKEQYMKQVETMLTLFERTFKEPHAVHTHAPGRVNLIGDHTDYNQGFVLPAAIDFGTDVYASKREDNLVKVSAATFDCQLVEFDLADIAFNKDLMWPNYVAGCMLILKQSGFPISGVNLLITGNIPQGGGLSSSASLEMAIIKVLATLFEFSLSGIQAAQLGQRVENEFVGCNCGIMDQLASAMGKESHAILLDCQSLEIQVAQIPKDWAILIINSNVKRGLVDSEYNLRRQQCEQAAKFFDAGSLRHVSLNQLNDANSKLDPLLLKRARHVITENERVLKAKSDLESSDMASLCKLMFESHESLKNDFETSVPQVDSLIDILRSELVPDNSGGARMTGGGFGGCVVAIVKQEKVDLITQLVKEQYPQKTGLIADLYLCKAVQGAFR